MKRPTFGPESIHSRNSSILHAVGKIDSVIPTSKYNQYNLTESNVKET